MDFVLTIEASCSQSSHHSGLPPRRRDTKRKTIAKTEMTPVIHAVSFTLNALLSWGLLHKSACTCRSSVHDQKSYQRNAIVFYNGPVFPSKYYLLNVSSYVHLAFRHGWRIRVEFFDAH